MTGLNWIVRLLLTSELRVSTSSNFRVSSVLAVILSPLSTPLIDVALPHPHGSTHVSTEFRPDPWVYIREYSLSGCAYKNLVRGSQERHRRYLISRECPSSIAAFFAIYPQCRARAHTTQRAVGILIGYPSHVIDEVTAGQEFAANSQSYVRKSRPVLRPTGNRINSGAVRNWCHAAWSREQIFICWTNNILIQCFRKI